MIGKVKVAAISLAVIMATTGVSSAQDVTRAVEARQSLMQLYAHYLGTLGAMAKGEMDYDGEKASAAASSLASLTVMDQSAMWPQGSDTDALGEKTAALPAIWTTYPAIAESGKAMVEAAAAMSTSAGTDLASLQAAMGDLGKACGSCHKSYRLKRN